MKDLGELKYFLGIHKSTVTRAGKSSISPKRATHAWSLNDSACKTANPHKFLSRQAQNSPRQWLRTSSSINMTTKAWLAAKCMLCSPQDQILHNRFNNSHNSHKNPQQFMKRQLSKAFDISTVQWMRGLHIMGIWDWSWSVGATQVGERKKEGDQSLDMSSRWQEEQFHGVRKNKALSPSQVWNQSTWHSYIH